jgi:8-oxo-dGTP pyrophosphatase MutT (NUDIX family)
MYRRVLCANCGVRGHVFKQCSHPIVSYGILCLRRSRREDKFLVVQRKDSFAFVEFMRGKYRATDTEYLLQLFEGMTAKERAAVAVSEFDDLWNMLWNGFAKTKSRPEYAEASKKFERLRDTSGADIDWLLGSTKGRKEPEWGFPKGRRSTSSESDVDCALRELHEETGIRADQVRLFCSRGDDGQPVRFQETFLGNNGVMYQHVYFLAELADGGAEIKTCDREIQQARWASSGDVLRMVRDAPTRVVLFEDALEWFDRPDSRAAVSAR